MKHERMQGPVHRGTDGSMEIQMQTDRLRDMRMRTTMNGKMKKAKETGSRERLFKVKTVHVLQLVRVKAKMEMGGRCRWVV